MIDSIMSVCSLTKSGAAHLSCVRLSHGINYGNILPPERPFVTRRRAFIYSSLGACELLGYVTASISTLSFRPIARSI